MNKKAVIAVVAVWGLAAGIGCAVWQDAPPRGENLRQRGHADGAFGV